MGNRMGGTGGEGSTACPALSLYCLSIGLLMAMNVAAVSGLADAAALLPHSILPWAASGIFWSILHYSCWKALPEKYRATTPARALGFLFIPLFNFYWAFISFAKLAIGFNAVKRDRRSWPYGTCKASALPMQSRLCLSSRSGSFPAGVRWPCW